MKKTLLSLLLLQITFVAFAQTTTNRFVSGTSSDAEINFFDESFQNFETVVIPGFTSNSASNGVFVHPQTKELYIALRENYSTALPALYKINPLDGQTTLVMTFSARYTMLDMAKNGKMYGVVGNGDSNQGELFEIDPVAQTQTFKTNLGLISGTKRTLGIHPIENKIYVFYAELWGSPKFDSILKVDLNTFAVQRTIADWDNLQISGATHLDADTFLLSSYDNFFLKYNTTTNQIVETYNVNNNQLDIVKINLLKPITSTVTGVTLQAIYDGTYEWFLDGGSIATNTTSFTTTLPGTYQALATINGTSNKIWSEQIIIKNVTTNRYVSSTSPASIQFFDESFQEFETTPISTFGSNSAAFGVFLHPTTKELYTAVREQTSNGTKPSLYKINPLSGETTFIMSFTSKYTMFDMASNGKIYAIKGNDETEQGYLYEIDPVAQTETFKVDLELISGTKRTLGINPLDDKIYVFYAELWGSPNFDSILKVDLNTFLVERTLGDWDNLQVSGATHFDGDTMLLSSYDSFFLKYNTLTNTIEDTYSVNDSQLDIVKVNLLKPSQVTTFCGNTSLTINAMYDGYYDWFRNGEIVSSQHVSSFTATLPGTYQALASINGTTNYVWTEPIVLTALPYPVVNITANPGLMICSGQTTTLTGSAGGSSQWYLNGGPITGAITTTYITSSTGRYNMMKTNLNGCKDSATIASHVRVNTIPVTSSISGNPGVCQNATGEVYSVTNNSLSTYTWTVPAGATITSTPLNSNSITVDWGTNGGVLSVSEANYCGVAPTKSITVTILTTPTTLNFSGPSVVCPSASGMIYSVDGPSNSTYAWTVNGGTQVAGADTKTITVDWGAIAGSLSVIETNDCGVTGAPSSYSVTASITPNTSAISGVSAACANSNGVVYSVVNTQFSSYTWTFPASATIVSTATNVNAITVNWGVNPSGVITVFETTSCGTGAPVSYTITNGTPSAPTVSSPLEICINSTASALTATGASLTWYTSIGATSGTTSITPSTAAAGSTDYFVTQTVGGCESAKATLTVTVGCVGIGEMDANGNLTLYPNPTNGIVIIKLTEQDVLVKSIELMNISGEMVSKVELNSNNGEFNIDLSNHAKGVYFVKVTSDKYATIKKVILQ